MQERVPRAKFARLEPEKAQFNGDQKLYEKMTASIKEREEVTVKTTPKTKKLSLKTEKNKFEPA